LISSAPRSLLGDVCTIASGGTPARSKPQYFGGSVPWVKITDLLQGVILGTGETLSEEGLDNCSAKVLPAGTVLVSIFATIGRTATLAISAATNQAIAGVTPRDQGSLSPAYLRYYLDSKRPDLERKAQGVAQPNINQGVLKSLEIPIPTIGEQRHIVDLLSRAENIVRMRREAEAKAKEIIPALFVDGFSERGGQKAGRREAVPNARLGDVLASIDSGVSPKCLDRSAGPNEWAVLKLGAVTWGEYDDGANKVLPIGQTPLERVEVRAGDVLISRKNTRELVGACSYVWETDGKRLLPDLIFRLIPKDASIVTPLYLWGLLSSRTMRQRLSALASGAAASMVNISKAKLLELPIPVPPIDLQKSFAARASECRELSKTAQTATVRAEQTFQSLLAGVFGEGR
jgi:type I restriction enzyme, S subunit